MRPHENLENLWIRNNLKSRDRYPPLHQTCRGHNKIKNAPLDAFFQTSPRFLSTLSPANTHRCCSLNASRQPYEEVLDLEQLQERMVQSLGEYNARSRKPMDLVMFMFAVEHVSRLARYV